jgi:hypothetical protein
MGKSTWMLAAGLLAGVACLPGCSSIDRTSDLQHHALVAGSSSKADVVNAIGLPAQTARDAGQGREYWYYSANAFNTSYFVPLPVAATASQGMTTVFYSDVGPKNMRAIGTDTQVFVFDHAGHLIDIRKPSTGKQE